MLHIFDENLATEIELRPHQDPEVVRLQGALHAAREALAPAAQVWKDYCAARADETVSIPFSRQKQRLYDTFGDRSLDVDEAEAAYNVALNEATQRATARWDQHIRRQFLDDLAAIEQFITVLEQHEALAVEAELAGIAHAISVSRNFITSREIAERLAYARKALGLEAS